MWEYKRGYPDINFVDSDTERLVNSMIKSYELFTGRTLYPADPTRLFILWIADIIIQERVIINDSAKQNVPRFANGDYLDSLGELFKDVYRLEATAAKTTFRFYLSKVLKTQQLIKKGTRVTVDGVITFETTENLYIKSGESYGDVSAVCQTIGTIGNGFVSGQVTQLVDIFPYYERVENITETAGGAQEEEDGAFYERMRESMESFSTSGPMGAYVYHAKTASALISDVVVSSPSPGVVDIRILLQNGELPGAEIIQKVLNVLTAEKTRPLTDLVQVSAPEAVQFDIEFKYYIPKPSVNSASIIEEDVEKAVNQYKQWQTEKIGRDINPSYLHGLLMKTGIKRAVINKPEYTVLDYNMVAVPNSSEAINGGIEDE